MNAGVPEAVWKKADPLAWQFVKDEGVIFDMDQQMLRGLNATGWFIWDLIDGRRDTASIVGQFANHFQISTEQAAGDVSAFLRDLEARGLALRHP